MNIGIIQPGRLGDLVILLPAAKYYADRGYTVYWPIMSQYVEMFSEVIDYVTFISVSNDIYKCVPEAYTILNNIDDIHIVDVAATFPGSESTTEYIKRGDGLKESFDVFKYDLLKVPFDEKWKLSINRNIEEENKLYDKLVKEDKYAVVCLAHSGGSVDMNMDIEGGQVIYITEDYNIFYWIKILEKATTIVLVESSMSNIVEQLNIEGRKILISKGDRSPVIKNVWRIL